MRFEKALRSFQTGGFTDEDVCSEAERQLAAGASPAELMTILQHQHDIEALPEEVYDSLAQVIASAQSAPSAPSAPLAQAVPIRPTETGAKPPFSDDFTVGDSEPLARRANVQRKVVPEPLLELRPVFGGIHWNRSAIACAVLLVVLVAGLFLYGRHAAQTPSVRSAAGASPAPAAASRAPAAVMVRDLPLGRFKQGTATADPRGLAVERPQHIVLIRTAIGMATNDVTVGDFAAFVAATGRNMQGCDVYDGKWTHRVDASWKNPGFSQGERSPVTCVSWNDAVAYASWLSTTVHVRYRLPSASEWEYAARAGSEAAQPWGSNEKGACAQANVADQSTARAYPGTPVFACDDHFPNTSPIESFNPNAFGLRDMLGNVSQWTQDCWHDSYVKAPIDGSARVDGDCGERELRGSSWIGAQAVTGFAHRSHSPVDYRSSGIGFRLVKG